MHINDAAAGRAWVMAHRAHRVSGISRRSPARGRPCAAALDSGAGRRPQARAESTSSAPTRRGSNMKPVTAKLPVRVRHRQQPAAERRPGKLSTAWFERRPELNPLALRDPTKERNDLDNTNIDEAAANDDQCGATRLQDGRICLLPALHSGPCGFEPKDRPPS